MVESDRLFEAKFESGKRSEVKQKLLRQSIEERFNDIDSIIRIEVSLIERKEIS